jgi:ADP-heptose:LPS heptosyltransferase
MNELNYIPLEEMLLMSFKASDEGDEILASEMFKKFEETKDKALKLAEKAVEAGDTKTVDVIIGSFQKAKEVSEKRVNTKHTDIEQTNYNSDDFEMSISDKLQNISDNSELTEQETVDALAKNILTEFQKSRSSLSDDDKKNKTEINENKFRKNKNKQNNTDTLLKKYLIEEKFDVGEKRARKLLIKNPKSAYLFNYLGVCLAQQKKFNEALESLDKSLSIEQNANDTVFNKSLINLRIGNFDKGWDLYSAGLSKDENIRELFEKYYSEKTQLWDGTPLNGTLLVYGEQGIGDQIMFGTIFEDLIKVQPKIAVVIDKRLKKLFQRTFPNIKFFGIEEDLSILNYSKHISMGGLCKFFRNDIKKFNYANVKPFISSYDIDNQIKTLMPSSKGLKIGLSWLTFAKKNTKRSLSSQQVASIISCNEHTFINLQYGNINNSLKEINQLSDKSIYQVPGVDLTNNLESLSSIISNCDLIITIDNSTAHLASALGKPVWILLPYANDFRWMENSEDTIWYKNTLLLRQTEKEDWSQVIYNINSALDQ